MNTNDFSKCVEKGKIGEERIKKQFKAIFAPVLNHIIYGATPLETAMQRNGIDFTIEQKPISFDVKCRKFYPYRKDILLETVSVIESNKPGWLWSSESDIILYLWENEIETKFIDGYILLLPEIRHWIKDRITKYQIKRAESYDKCYGSVWHTENRAVPISEFPAHVILRINRTSLNPSDQEKLSDWFE